jgi:ADP-ribosylglycohydrolase
MTAHDGQVRGPDGPEDRAAGALLGLALGDALGWPAAYHRTLALPPKRRARLWGFSAQTDQHRVTTFTLPYTHSGPEAVLDLGPTDDAEFAAVAARVLLDCGDDPSPERLFAAWRRHVADDGDRVWSPLSTRIAITNARKGLVPPATGGDNPQHYDDAAVPGAVAVGIRHHGRPEKAAHDAGQLAAITHAADGVWAAQAMAAAVAVAVGGGDLDAALAAAEAQIPADSWLGRNLRRAQACLDEAGSGFAAVPLWNDRIVNHTYNYGNAAPETLPVALSVLRATDGALQPAVTLAALVPKQADSMPAMAGAIAGALQGAAALPPPWPAALDTLRGLCLPALAGQSLRALATALLG